jgi:hypothetical protein
VKQDAEVIGLTCNACSSSSYSGTGCRVMSSTAAATAAAAGAAAVAAVAAGPGAKVTCCHIGSPAGLGAEPGCVHLRARGVVTSRYLHFA